MLAPEQVLGLFETVGLEVIPPHSHRRVVNEPVDVGLHPYPSQKSLGVQPTMSVTRNVTLTP